MNLEKVYGYKFNEIYKLYVSKIVKKGREEVELIQVLSWLLDIPTNTVSNYANSEITLAQLLTPLNLNPKSSEIKGVVCGVRVETLEESTYKKIRLMDKVVDELAKGWPLDKIKRSTNL